MAKIKFVTEQAEASNQLVAQNIPTGHFFRTLNYTGNSWFIRIYPTANHVRIADLDTHVDYIFAVDVSSGVIHLVKRNTPVVAASKVYFKAVL